MPFGLDLPWPSSGNKVQHSTAEAWGTLIDGAKESLNIVCFYMTLNATDESGEEVALNRSNAEEGVANGHVVGMDIYHKIIAAGERGVDVKIVESYPSTTYHDPSLDARRLQERGLATVRLLNMTKLYGSGVVHTKLFVVDGRAFYVGSANADWRSLTQVKELGVVVDNEALAQDAQRAFDVYWDSSENSQLPLNSQNQWPPQYWALFDATNPAHVQFDSSPKGERSDVYLTSSPDWFCANQRTYDLDAIQGLMNHAKKTISISVMDYFPTSLYFDTNFYWPEIDDAMRVAAFNSSVEVRLLVSKWNHTYSDMYQWLYSLNSVHHIEVRLMELPDQPDVKPVPYTRVNHCKYMVTDEEVLITTSNWSADYFLSTTGSSLVSNDVGMVEQVQAVFDRDWNSEYSKPL